MVYYHIRLSENASNLCTIIIPWVKYRYKFLPMGVASYPDIIQHKTNDLIHELGFIPEYIDDLLVLTRGDWTYRVQKLELTLTKLKVKGLKYNIEKSFFVHTKMEYLGFWDARNDAKSIHKKI